MCCLSPRKTGSKTVNWQVDSGVSQLPIIPNYSLATRIHGKSSPGVAIYKDAQVPLAKLGHRCDQMR